MIVKCDEPLILTSYVPPKPKSSHTEPVYIYSSKLAEKSNAKEAKEFGKVRGGRRFGGRMLTLTSGRDLWNPHKPVIIINYVDLFVCML